VEFLVEIEIRLPTDLGERERADLIEAEFAQGRLMAQAGHLRAIWRIPGRRANLGIWAAADASALHEALSGLPMWPYMDITVTALAAHPLSDACPGPGEGH